MIRLIARLPYLGPPRRIFRPEAFVTWRDHLALWLATSGGAGFAPRAPGTAGAMVGLPLAWWSNSWSLAPRLIFWSLLTIIGVWAAQRFDECNGTEDNQNTVIDETVGVGITAWIAGQDWRWLLVAFVLFRAFDILKPPPVGWLDRWSHSPGARASWLKGYGVGFGVMADDVVAGFQGLLVLALLMAWM